MSYPDRLKELNPPPLQLIEGPGEIKEEILT